MKSLSISRCILVCVLLLSAHTAWAERLKDMAVVSGQLVVFKPNAVYTILGYDTATFQVVELTTRLGIIMNPITE